MMAKGKEIEKVERYLPGTVNEELADIVRENIGDGGEITPFDLECIGMPTGGAMQFVMPDGDVAKTFEAVIVAWSNARAFWPGEFSGGEPPQCASQGGVLGAGDPGGACATCPFGQFGSSPKEGGGQACKAMRRLLLFMPGRVLPVALTLPPTSLKGSRAYFVKLVSKRIPYYGVVTTFTLEAAQNSAGIKYGKIVTEAARLLDEDELAEVKGYLPLAKGMLNTAPIEAADYNTGVEL